MRGRSSSRRPVRSGRRGCPTTNGPAARPSRLLARVNVPKAVERIDAGVRFATIAPAGPAVPAAKNAPAPISTSCSVPGHGRSRGKQHQRQRARRPARSSTSDREVPCEPVGDHAADDHADAHEQDEAGSADGGLVRRKVVGAAEVAGHPGEQRAGDEQLQAAADVGADDRRGGDQGAQLRAFRRGCSRARPGRCRGAGCGRACGR